MSNNIHHPTSRSRSSSIDDQNAENDISVYATPRPDTPFVTPNSTPRLIHCRLNPVTTVRQHVPLKINFTQETRDSTSDQAALSKFNEIKPMNTKKVKCVIQTNPLYQEGDGDQAAASNSKHSTKNSNEFAKNSISSHCHPEGDAEIEPSPGIANNDNQLADDFQSVAVIEKEIELMDRFVKDSIERLQKNCDIKTNSDGCDVLPTANCDHNNKGEKSKPDKIFKCNPGNKNCAQETNLPPGHKCEKKKFYDPEDIRKYMLKKKTERLAKEKEERCKKECEALALKRKSEATKNLVTKTRIPVLRSHHINEPEVQTESKGKVSRGTKSLSLCPKTAEDVKIPKQMCLNDGKPDYQRRYSKNLPQCNDTGDNPDATNKNEPKSMQNYGKNSAKKVAIQRSNSDHIFIANSNRVINQSTENNRKISISEVLPSTEHDSSKVALNKTRPPEDKMPKQTSPGFPEELDVLKSKNPYNFLNILKGKVNLARNSVDGLDSNKDLHEDFLTEAFSPSLLKKNDHLKLNRDQFLENIINRRIKVGTPATLPKKLNDLKSDEESENVEPSRKIAEISPPKNNLTFRIWPSGKTDKTYTVLDSVEKSNTNIINDKNLSLDISGIKSLSPDDKKNSKKPFLEDEFVPGKINAPDDALLTGAIESNLDSTLTLESLQADNVSLALPESFAKKDEKEDSQLSLKNLSVDVRRLLEDESMFGSGIIKGADTSSVIGKTSEKALSRSSQNFGLNESSIVSSDDLTNLSTTAVFLDIYDQMIKNEDEKLSQILKKIHQQKIALNKYLKKEVFALESKKNIYRENKDEDKIKAIKKRQRAILLKITKNIQELEKMKKSVTDTVERRKTEILRQKNAMKERKEQLKQKFVSPKKRRSEGNSKTFVISKQTNTLFMGISSSSSTSMLIDNGENGMPEDTEKEMSNYTEGGALVKNCVMKDIATSPVNFDTGISIKFELDPDKLLQLKNLGEIRIDPLQLQQIGKTKQLQSLSHESTDDYPSLVNEREKSDKNSGKIKIKRPLSPVVLPPSRNVSQLRRLSSSSDVTFASLNDTTTDQSDVELRISALQEQLRQRKLEAERLRREEKQLRKEKLRAKEQSLLKQLEAYDQYIQKVTNMLSEDRSLSEVAKPQIKPVTKRSSPIESADKHVKHTDFKEPSVISLHDTNISAKNKIYDDIDGENTEDSEKHLRKADSGILMESEVTEVSENVEIRKSKSESEIHSDVKSERIAEKLDSEAKNGGGSKSMDNFLQLINDIQSEVVSMSEQVYSSDFVEDIPEDIPDSKSEVSENATYNNTSLSIEEILSDHQYHSDVEPKSIISEPSIAKDNFSSIEITNKQSEKENASGKPEESDLSDIFVLKNISDIESSPSDHQKPSTILSEKISTRDDTNRPSIDEDLPTENTLKNTAVDMSPVEELKMISSVKNTASEVTPVEEIQTVSSLKNIPSEDIPVEKPAPDSFSETPLTEIGDNSVFFDFSQAEESGNVDSTINEEFIKYESEGSCVADVDEPVRKTDDIQTMMDGLEFSPQFNNFSITEDFESNEAEQNFDQILNNLGSYFSVKITPVNEDLKILSLPESNLKENQEDVKADAKSPVDENLSPIKITEIGLEETDVSESLEYDTTPTEHSTNQKYDIHCMFSEKPKLTNETKQDEDSKLEIQTKSVKSDADAPKKYTDELSAEEDRSVEEFLEDFSIPNLGTSTFIVNDDSELEVSQEMENKPESLSPVESVSEVQSDMAEQAEDLDQKINVDQTPFLEALRREHETLNSQKQEVFENITSELLDKLLDENYASALDEITKNADLEEDDKEKANESTNETPITKLDIKVDEAVLKKHTKINNDWLDKELNFNRERLREAEELKLQQMRIEQEIEELQAQQHIPPYLYLREIPNKPPPPYTPPSENASVRIPQNETELQSLINPAIHYVCKSLKRGIKIDDIKQLPEYTQNGKSNTEIATYKKFIFDLIKEVARNILETNKTKPCLPWESSSKHRKPKLSPKEEDLPGLIENEILVLFGFRSKINKEKLIIQWSRKKRNDFVDDLLIKELQDEEAEWKNYEEDENIIKNQITQNILDELIRDTVDGLQEAIDKKNRSSKE